MGGTMRGVQVFVLGVMLGVQLLVLRLMLRIEAAVLRPMFLILIVSKAHRSDPKQADHRQGKERFLQARADSAEGRRPSTGPEKRSAPRAGQRLGGVVASRGRPPARSLRDRSGL